MRKLSIISIAASLLFGSCTKDLSSLNLNPKAATTAVPGALFTQGQLNLALAISTPSVSQAPFRVLSQEWTEYTYTYEANYNFSAYNSPGGWWTGMYVGVIHNLDQAKAGYATSVAPAEQIRNEIIIADLLEIDTYYMLTATYGDIPYTQAENPVIPFPAYDDSHAIVTDLLLRVDSCIAGLDVSSNAMGDADLVYGGDPAAWLKFAASLKLKMAMLLADVDPATATTKVNEAIATGIFTSNGDNALFQFDGANPDYSNPVWNALDFSGRHDFLPSNLIVDTMVDYGDPRVPLYFTETTPGNGIYTGGVPGNTNSAGYGSGAFSDFGPALQNATTPSDLLDYAQVEFYLAEAIARGFVTTGSAATEYGNAITASIEFWGGSSADAATYIATPAVAYVPALWKQKIGLQEWIADYNNNWDSWTTIRRLGPDLETINPPTDPASDYPVRYYYPPNEATSNSVNYKAAVAKLPGGVDVVTAKLFWEP